MKKTLVALAALAAVSAYAQSSVTLYGRMDLGTQTNKATSVTTGPTGIITTNTTTKLSELAGADGVRTGSRLGVRVSEDLGGGLRANAIYEFRLDPDDVASTGYGASTSNFGRTRLGLLQLAGGFGSVSIGTYMNTIDDARSFSAGTAGTAGGDFLYNNNAGLTDGRSTNAIGYSSPDFGGFKFKLGTTNQKVAVTTAGVTATTQSKGWIGGISYDNGPLAVLFAAGAGKAINAAGTSVANYAVVSPGLAGASTTVTAAAAAGTAADLKLREMNLSASYNFGVAIPYLMIQKGKVTNNLAAAGTQETKHTGYELGSKFPMGAFTPYVLVARAKTTGGGVGLSSKNRAYQVGTTYDLSKRTYTYLSVGQSKNTTATAGSLASTETKNRGWSLGLVHSF